MSGAIGSEISIKDGLKKSDINEDFVPVDGKVPIITKEHEAILQNRDIKLFYYLCRLVQTKDSNLFKYFDRSPGHVHNAR